MKHCPNPDCPFLARMGEIAEYQDHVEQCIDCGETLLPGEAPTEQLAAYRAEAAAPPPGTLIVVATFLRVIEAHAWRARLESEGIPAFLADEQMGSLYGGFYAYITNGVRLLVPEADVERALLLLEEKDSD